MNLDRLQIWLDKDTRPGDDNIRWHGTSDEECKEIEKDRSVKAMLDNVEKNNSLIKKLKESPLNTQIGGNHYKDCKIQPVQYIEANKLLFLEGCVVKRATRHDKPTGKGREDIEKAIHELQLILELRYGD